MSLSSPTTPRDRSRSHTVCSTCRQRKTRCDRRQPSCGFCTKNGIECQYLPRQQRTPGLRAGYVSQLEARIENLEQELREFKDQVSSSLALCSTPCGANSDVGPSDENRPHLAPRQKPPQVANLAGKTRHTSAQSGSSRLSKELVTELCSVWFQECHSWFPILHEPTVQDWCSQYSAQSNKFPVLKSIAVYTIPTRPLGTSATKTEREAWLSALKDEIVLSAFHNLGIESLQALLILALVELGSSSMIDYYNVIALCRSISVQLGLRDLVAYHCVNFGISSAIPPRMLCIPTSTVEREEKIRAFWATEALHSSATVGAAWNDSISPPYPTASDPCDDVIWRYPESILGTYYFGTFDTPSSFSLLVRFSTNELWHVHRFLQESYDAESMMNDEKRQNDCDSAHDRLMQWHGDFERVLAASTPQYADLFASETAAAQHPNCILIHCTLYSAIISLYQRFVYVPLGAEVASWPHALDRCMHSSNRMTEVVRGVSDDTLDKMNPQYIFCVFIAARFYLIYSRAAGQPMPNKLHLLMYCLTLASNRWPLAAQLHKVLEAATAETLGNSISEHPLPKEFYDLQYLSLDIHEALRKWAIS